MKSITSPTRRQAVAVFVAVAALAAFVFSPRRPGLRIRANSPNRSTGWRTKQPPSLRPNPSPGLPSPLPNRPLHRDQPFDLTTAGRRAPAGAVRSRLQGKPGKHRPEHPRLFMHARQARAGRRRAGRTAAHLDEGPPRTVQRLHAVPKAVPRAARCCTSTARTTTRCSCWKPGGNGRCSAK